MRSEKSSTLFNAKAFVYELSGASKGLRKVQFTFRHRAKKCWRGGRRDGLEATIFCHSSDSKPLRIVSRAVILEVDPDAIDCRGFYPDPDIPLASDTPGERVGRQWFTSGKRFLGKRSARPTCLNHEQLLRANRMPTAVGSGGNAHGNAHRYRQ